MKSIFPALPSPSVAADISELLLRVSKGVIEITAETITIGEDAELSARTREQATGKAGNITLKANQVNISGELGIFAETEGEADAGNLTINPNGEVNLNVDFTSEGTISASTSGTGKGGDIDITAAETINLTGNGSIKVEASSSGNAGNILIDSNQINITEGVEISASTTGSGNAGNINLDANLINLNQAEINAFTNATGNAGSITLSSQDGNVESVTLINSLISTEIQSQGEANSPSNITIKTNNLVGENSIITASTSGKGDAGSITIPNGQQINLINSDIIATTKGEGNTGEINLTATEKINLANQSEISSSVETGGVGNSLSVNLSTPELELNQSQINAFTDARGNAGSITISNQDNNNNQVTLTNQSQISTEIRNNGQANQLSNITIKTDNLKSENSTITASTSGKGDAGNITIPNGQQINLINSDIIATTKGEGNTGEINLTAIEKINLTDKSEISSSVETGGIGDSRQITLNTPQLQLTNNAQISAASAGIGNAGQISIPNSNTVFIDTNSTISSAILPGGIAQQPANITIKTNALTLDNHAEITASSAGQGEGGNITINTTTPLTLNNQGRITSALDETGSGKGGNININAPSLLLDKQSEINASTFGIGEGGFIRLIIDHQIDLDNASVIATAVEPTAIGIGGRIEIDTQQLNLAHQSQLRASTLGQGNADSITIRANTVELINGSKILTETDSQFDAGNITLTLGESLFISDDGSGLFANTEEGSSGDGGSIFIDPQTVFIRDGATIAVDGQGSGKGGNIQIQSGSLTLDNQASISAETASNTGGDITLQIQELLLLRRGSQISTTAGTAQAGGDGGNMTIDAAFIAAVPNEDSNITANAFLGNGGTINITTQGIFGLQFQDQETFLSDITASSEFGLAGVIEINRPDLDPSQGLIELSEETVDVAGLINQNLCVAGQGSEFIIPGSGGLPDSPKEVLNVDGGWEDWRIEPQDQQTDTEQPMTEPMPVSRNSQPRTKKQKFENIVQAQGWIVAPNGNLILTTKPVTVTPQGIWLSPLDCQMMLQ